MGGIFLRLFVHGVLYLLFWVTPAWASEPIAGVDPFWAPLVERLVADGEDPKGLAELFSRDAVRFDPRVMPRKLTHSEVALNYERFLAPERIRRARSFLAKNQDLLCRVEKDFGVPKEIQTAVFLIETDLGAYLGGGNAFTVLASMARAGSIEEMAMWLPLDSMAASEREGLDKRLRDKSEWAYQELRALLRHSREGGIDPVTTPASIFGAIGLCQFMPTNVIKYGVDRDADGRVNLFTVEDAAASMANYLRSHGWRPGLGRDDQLKVILAYNYSRPYARTVLAVAERLGWNGGPGESPTSCPGR
ncbi:MAG: lytic murein transglycosylase [Deltaproteobacteria bacterium]